MDLSMPRLMAGPYCYCNRLTTVAHSASHIGTLEATALQSASESAQQRYLAGFQRKSLPAFCLTIRHLLCYLQDLPPSLYFDVR